MSTYLFDRNYPVGDQVHVPRIREFLARLELTDCRATRSKIIVEMYRYMVHNKTGRMSDRFRAAMVRKIREIYACPIAAEYIHPANMHKPVDALMGPTLGPIVRGVGSKL